MLQKEMGFSYHQLLGELIYAYIVAHLDIGCAITLLSQFSQAPHKDHYTASRTFANTCMPPSHGALSTTIPLDGPPTDDTLPVFPAMPLHQLVGYVDAAHATDLRTRCSITGIVYTLAGGAIAFKSKVQPKTATSSTGAE
jgi:hypothetical protein